MHARWMRVYTLHAQHTYKNMVNINGLRSAYEILSINTGQSSRALAADGNCHVDEPSHNNIQISFGNRSIYTRQYGMCCTYT